MAREQLQSLTEQMYYILLALLEPVCGVEISHKAMEISENRIQIGPGTLYALLGKFEKELIIQEVKTVGRKRYYQITEKGYKILLEEYRRLQHLVREGKPFLDQGGIKIEEKDLEQF
ncbi:MAG: PadR family transcriptional regulator [Anaerocolumna sp.]|jgi:DNA-binding PadR family transcriptional regulator|nr:PadR family transcriptional regulator [Anaerocolumna sp.]